MGVLKSYNERWYVFYQSKSIFWYIKATWNVIWRCPTLQQNTQNMEIGI